MATNEVFVRDFYNKLIGIVETLPNGDKVVRDFNSRKILGYYRKDTDCTTDFYGRILSKGDTAISLIYTNNK